MLEFPHGEHEGPETRFAKPGATLFVLDALRFPRDADEALVVHAAVESLLGHWTSREPIGPCHYGIGSRFMQVEFPFLRYHPCQGLQRLIQRPAQHSTDTPTRPGGQTRLVTLKWEPLNLVWL